MVKEFIGKVIAVVMLLAIAPTVIVLYSNFLSGGVSVGGVELQTYTSTLMDGANATLLLKASETYAVKESWEGVTVNWALNNGSIQTDDTSAWFRFYGTTDNAPNPLSLNYSGYYLMQFIYIPANYQHEIKIYYWDGSQWVLDEHLLSYNIDSGHTNWIKEVSGLLYNESGITTDITPPYTTQTFNFASAMIAVMTIGIAAAAISKLE